jgi:hypothetical protein
MKAQKNINLKKIKKLFKKKTFKKQLQIGSNLYINTRNFEHIKKYSIKKNY